jgi:acyl-CoA synthetase (AMP-forming)/AMP-acid ligase II
MNITVHDIGRIALEHKATILIGTPTFLMAWVRKIDPEAFAKLRWVCVGAEKLRPKLSAMFEKRYGIRPLEGYGAPECSPVIAVNVPDVEYDGLCQTGQREGTVGRPLPNLLTRVVDPETFVPVALGEPGLLLVKGPSVMRGYLNNPAKTAEALIDGWYNTGDIVRLDEDGFITITDRLTRFSKLAGEMVSHSAVELALQEALRCAPDQRRLSFEVPALIGFRHEGINLVPAKAAKRLPARIAPVGDGPVVALSFDLPPELGEDVRLEIQVPRAASFLEATPPTGDGQRRSFATQKWSLGAAA